MSQRGNPEIRKISFNDYQDEIGELRIRAWKNEYGISQSFFSRTKWIDEIDLHPDVHHWVIIEDGVIQATGRLSFHHDYQDIPYADYLENGALPSYGPLPMASINRLVVAPEHRGKGLARRLDEQRIEFASQNQASAITAQPMEERVNALTQLGFKMVGLIKSPFQIPERRIYFMVKKLDRQI